MRKYPSALPGAAILSPDRPGVRLVQPRNKCVDADFLELPLQVGTEMLEFLDARADQDVKTIGLWL